MYSVAANECLDWKIQRVDNFERLIRSTKELSRGLLRLEVETKVKRGHRRWDYNDALLSSEKR